MSRPLPGFEPSHLLYLGAVTEVWVGALSGPSPAVAVKRAIDPTDRATGALLTEEAERAAAVRHPGLLSPVAVLEDGPGVAIAYPYLGGGSVRSLLDRRGALTAGQVVALLAPVADALAARAAHPAGGAHGDLKPDNLLLHADGRPVVADPGGPGRATPAYLDPAAVPVGGPSVAGDVFSLAVLAYEALTARQPHRGAPAEVVALAGAGAHRRLDTWPGIAPAVAAAVEAGLSPDPAARPTDPAAFVATLAAAVDPATVVLAGSAPPTRLVRPGAASATLDLGIRPGAPVAVTSELSGRWRAWAAAAGVLAVVSLAARVAPAGGPARPAAADGGRCDRVAPGLVAVDLDGDGCDDPATWDGRLLAGTTPGSPRLRVGGPGVTVHFGDWDGDGATSLASYEPAVGRVRYLDRLDRPGVERVERVARRGRSVVVSNAGRDRVEVHPIGPTGPTGPTGPGER